MNIKNNFKEIVKMKKYETPKLEIILLNKTDIIATSGTITDTPEMLVTWGTNVDIINAQTVNIFE